MTNHLQTARTSHEDHHAMDDPNGSFVFPECHHQLQGIRAASRWVWCQPRHLGAGKFPVSARLFFDFCFRLSESLLNFAE